MTFDERGDGALFARWRGLDRHVSSLPQLVEVREVGEHSVCRHAEVEETGDFIHADLFHLIHHREAARGSAEETARFVIAGERIFHECFKVLLSKGLEVDIGRRRRRAAGLSKG